ncbi:MAG: restriction endonuclease subunit S [Bacteroidales bacterium]|nr:restriction endonuclease subunit S [Bacteroidales bacterium]
MDTKKLRQKILDLAIHGKLVPQDPNDEPASVLLERIRKEKEQLIREGKIKAPKKGKSAGDRSHYMNNVPWDLPEGWVWTTLSDIGTWQSGATPRRGVKAYYGGTIPWLKTGDLNDDYIQDIPERITGKALEETSVKLNPEGSVLIAMYGATIGKVGILMFPATTNQACCACSEFAGVDNKYLFYYLMSHKDTFLQQAGGGAQPNISKEIIVNTPIPVPPIREQKRIVREIEKWLGIIRTIAENEQSVMTRLETCRAKILDLAIHGRLVPQDPSDEPAIELLKRINPNFKPAHNLQYEDCPIGWQVVTLKEIISLYSGRDLEAARCNTEHKGIPYLVGASCIDNQNISVYRWTEYPGVIAKKDDILLSCKGTVGEVVLNQLGDVHIARQFMAIRSKSPQFILPKYIELIIKASIEKLRSTARGIIPGISREDIMEMIVAVPPLTEQQRILTRMNEVENSLSLISLKISG